MIKDFDYEEHSVVSDSTAPSFVDVPDSGSWSKGTFFCVVPPTFQNYQDALRYMLADETFGNGNEPETPEVFKEMLDEYGKDDEVALPKRLIQMRYRDTSLGGNEALNCYPQFDYLDDLVHPEMSLGLAITPEDQKHVYQGTSKGMGRVYAETFDMNQKILYLTFGTPEFSGVTEFYTKAFDNDLMNLMKSGDFLSMETLGRLLGTAVGMILALPLVPFKIAKRLWNMVPDLSNRQVTKYYDMRSTMPLYFKCVNNMIAHMGVNLALTYPSKKRELGQAEAVIGTDSDLKDLYETETIDDEGNYTVQLPKALAEGGWDIYSINKRKYMLNNIASGKEASRFTDLNIDGMIEEFRKAYKDEYATDKDRDMGQVASDSWDEFWQSFNAGIQDATTFIGFRVEKSVDNVESISNSTGESSLASTLNSNADAHRERVFSFMGGTTGVDAIDGFTKALSGFLNSSLDSIGLADMSKVLIGSGRLDIPDVWKGSSFTKNYSFNMTFSTPYPDPISVMQRVYIPFFCILAGALPRAAGRNAYGEPFVCSAYCPGFFGAPLAIIDNMTIRRGKDKHGWTRKGLPKTINVSFSIKDLSPAMYLAISTDSNWLDIFGQNSTFVDYLTTLSGMGLADRLLWSRNMERRFTLMRRLVLKEKLNPHAWGSRFAYSKIGRVISACRPDSDIGDLRR